MPNDTQIRCYKSNYLTNVIFRVDFPQIFELSANSPPSKLQEKIIDKFPITSNIKEEEFLFEIKPDQEAQTTKSENISWQFMNKEKTTKVIINSKFIHIECGKYETFGNLFESIELILKEFINLYPVKIANRVGLRYINQIHLDSGDPLNWTNLINPNLVAISEQFVESKEKIMRSMHFLEVGEEDYNLKFQFGLFNSEYPGYINKKEFVLDYDCSNNGEIDMSQVPDTTKQFHKIIYDWFEESICEGLRQAMGELNGT